MQKPDANSDRLKWNSRTAIVGDEIVWGNTANAVGCKDRKEPSVEAGPGGEL